MFILLTKKGSERTVYVRAEVVRAVDAVEGGEGSIVDIGRPVFVQESVQDVMRLVGEAADGTADAIINADDGKMIRSYAGTAKYASIQPADIEKVEPLESGARVCLLDLAGDRAIRTWETLCEIWQQFFPRGPSAGPAEGEGGGLFVSNEMGKN